MLFAHVFVFYYSMFCDCLTSRQIILSLKIKKLLYVMRTFEDTIYQFVACKNHVLFAFNSDKQRSVFLFVISHVCSFPTFACSIVSI